MPPRPRTIGVGIVAAALWLFAPRLSQACTIPEDEFNNVVETFNEPDSRFESQYTKITDGKLRITAEADPVAPLTALEPGSYNDFDACVTVENKQATFHQNYKAWAGLAFWANEEATDFYAFVVDAKRSFAVLQFKNDQPSELVGWSKNDAIGPVTTLRVVTAKDHVTCFANDVQVCNLTITPPGAGSLGFAVWQNEKSGASFDFDNFVVIEPKGSTP